MILQSKHFYVVFRKNDVLFSIFPVVSASKSMKRVTLISVSMGTVDCLLYYRTTHSFFYHF